MSSDNYSLFGEPTTTDTAAPSTVDNYSLFEPTKSLEERKAEKLANLGQKSQFSNLSDSYTQLDNGIFESNANKIWNNLSGAEFSSIWDYASNNLALGQDDNGYYNISTGERYEGPVRRAYGYGTQADDTTYKFGLARGDRDSSDSRYTDYAVGPEGVDISKKQHDILLPDYIAQTVEALGHGREEALAGRVVPDRLDLENYDRFGGGATEYYKSKEAFFGDPTAENYGTAFTPEQAKEVLYQYATQDYVKSPYYKGKYSDKDYLDTYYKRLAEGAMQSKYEAQTAVDEALQTVSALPAGVAKGFLDLVDAGQEVLTYLPQLAARVVTGDNTLDIDLFDDGYKQAAVEFADSLVGYDRKLDEVTLQRALTEFEQSGMDITSWDSIKETLTDPDKRGNVGEALLLVLTDPSVTAGMVSELFGSGGGLGAVTKGGTKLLAKVAPGAEKLISGALQSNLATVRTEVAAAQAAGDAAKVAQLQRSYTIGQRFTDLLKGSVYTNADMMVRMNNDITAFKQNNNGEDPSAEQMLRMAILNRIVSTTEMMSLKSLVGMKDVPGVVAREAAKRSLVRATGETVGRLVKSGLIEGTQETVDTIVEQINQKLDAADFEGQSLEKILSDASAEILTSMVAGMAGGVQISGGKAALDTVGAGFRAAGNAVGSRPAPRPQQDTPESREAEMDVARNVEANVARMATATTPAAAYYSAQGSENVESRQQAQATATEARDTLLDGSNGVFQSDEDFTVKLGRVKDLVEIAVAEDPSIKEEDLVASVIKGLNAANEQEQAQVTETVSQGFRDGQQFASIKPLVEVAKDVSTGVRGFVTYFTGAKAALADGDTKAYEDNISKLENFYFYESNKLDRWDAGVKDVRSKIETAVDNAVKMGKAKTRREALANLLTQYIDSDKRATVANSDRPNAPTTDIKYADVANQMLNPRYNSGIFKLMGNVKNEVAQMGKVYDSLMGNITEENVEVPPAPEVDTQTSAEAALSEEDRNSITQRAVTDVGRQGSASVKGVDDRREVILKSMGQEAADFYMAEVQRIADANLADYQARKAAEAQAEAEPTLDVPPASAYEEDFAIPAEDNLDVPPPGLDEGFDVPAEENFDVPVEEDFTVEEEPTAQKDASVQEMSDNKAALKDIKKRIAERRAELRARNITGKAQLEDAELVALLEQKAELDATRKGFTSKLNDLIARRLEALGDRKDRKFTLYVSYGDGGKPVETTLGELFKTTVATGFTITERTAKNTFAFTKKFANKLLENMKLTGKFPVQMFNKVQDNPATFLLFDDNGELNYNTVEAMQSAAYEYLVQEASNLGGANRTDEEVGDLIGIPEEYVTPEMTNALAKGGITLKLAAAAIGDKVIKNLGLQIESVQDREALATSLGIATLEGLKGDFVQGYNYIPSEAERTRKRFPLKAKSIPFIIASPTLFDRMNAIRDANDAVENTLGVEIDKERTYRTVPNAKPRKVMIHRAEYQEAPKDHEAVTNRLEQTAFTFNSGHDVLMEMFSKEGTLDTEALIEHILGSEKEFTNHDARKSYKAQKEALKRSLMFYQEAYDDVKDGEMFFNWFIAKNHRIHLDSNRLNPQNDKNLARWLVTTANSRTTISKADIKEVLDGNTDNMQAKMFAYAVVQAFDGAKGIPGIDKDNEAEVLAAAKKLLEDTPEGELFKMAMDAGHLGHAALAIANIRKYMDNDSFESDLVLEVDGLTNGFAFRAMQFPVESESSPLNPMQWLEKVGVITEESELFGLDSMNGARTAGQEDVYISVGAMFNQNIAEAKDNLDGTSAKWVALFEKHGKLPDFSDSNSADVKKFIRNLMKSPVMIFNYAAGLGRIAGGLVNDQIMGKGYLKGKGLVDLLTAKDENDNYVLTKKELVDSFGEMLGNKYHKARVALHENSLDSTRNGDITVLKAHLTKAVSGLYTESLTATLETLFSKQTVINSTFVNAAQFMFDHFKDQYSLWLLKNPEATDEAKLEFLKDMAAIIPGVGAASSDDQMNKITFLKNVLEPTNNDVVVNIAGQRIAANTVSRTFGEPGVGPAVLTVLSLDSSVLAKTINESYKGVKGKAALPIHDAIVLGIDEHGVINSYNRNFYTTNRSYSISEEFVRAIETFEQSVPGAAGMSIIDIEGKRVTFSEMKAALTQANNEIQTKRRELFGKNVKVGQLVGPEGTMESYDVATMKDMSKAYMANVATNILEKFDSDDVKTALGKDYAKHMKAIAAMLEGCK